ncbi:MAG: S-layer homology domain-containing protein, partial [Clostridia bacterium]|nr:S-layer homology domain-containing protein [Clostridia bacterium]
INYLNLAIPAPETGKTPDYNGVISEEGVSFVNGGDEYTRNGIRWGKFVNDFGIGENDLFASGLGYRATIYLAVDEGYALHKNHEGEYDTLVFVNGEPVEYETDGNKITVCYEVNADEVVVSSIDMKGIDYPEIGNKPDCTSESVEPHYYDLKEASAITWYEDGEYMDKSDTFKDGKTYSVEMYVDAVRVGWDDVVTFTDTPVASLNGFSIDSGNVERLNDTTVKISYTFPKVEKEKAEEIEKPTEIEKPGGSEEPTQPEKPVVTDKPQEPEKSAFVDVSKDAYYYQPVMWAVENGITSGTSENTFSPDADCTRAQVVTFLWRMIASPEPAAIENPFVDVKADAYYYKPVMWAVGSNITGGTSANTFSPDENCTRAQVVAFLWRTAGQPKPEGKSNTFTDVKADSYYYDAVLWAVENGITSGTGENIFSPDDSCTRAQVVTFLYRFINN